MYNIYSGDFIYCCKYSGKLAPVKFLYIDKESCTVKKLERAEGNRLRFGQSGHRFLE